MSAGINIAFPKFQVIGESVDKDELETLQQRYDKALEDIVTALNKNPPISLGGNSKEDTHERLIEIKSPSESGRVIIRNHEDAVRFADSIKADIVVYGTIDLLSKNTALIQPKIYIAPHSILVTVYK